MRDHRVYRALWWALDHGPRMLMSVANYELYIRDRVEDGLERGAIDRSDILSALRTANVRLTLPQVRCSECCLCFECQPMPDGTMFGLSASATWSGAAASTKPT